MAVEGAPPPGDAGAHDLTRIRAQLRLSQADLAAMVGVSESEMAEMEAENRPVPPDLLTELMEELNLKGA